MGVAQDLHGKQPDPQQHGTFTCRQLWPKMWPTTG